jgi:hypothetical protein
VLAAIHALVIGMLAHLHVHFVLRHWLRGSRSSRRLGGHSGRDNQRDHDSIS